MNVSTPLVATHASAEMGSCCMKMAMTVKKVSSSLPALRKHFEHSLLQDASMPGVPCLYHMPDSGTEKVPVS